MRFQRALVRAGVFSSRVMCFCCTARISVWGLQSTGETAAGCTTFVFLSHVLHGGKDISGGSSIHIEIFPWLVAGSAEPAPTSSG